MGKKAQYHPNLFEPTETQSTSSPLEEKTSSPPKIANPCPRCGARGQKSVRPMERGGLTHYCSAGCLSEDRMDCFYFTPVAETFDEQAESEAAKAEAKRIVASEPAAVTVQETLAALEEPSAPREIETETVNAAMPATDLFGVAIEPERAGALAERFIVPPFSVLDAKQGYWTKRKAEWVAMGITSEKGRMADRLGPAPAEAALKAYKNPSSNPGQNTGQDLMRGEGKQFGVIGGAPLPLDRKKARISGVCHEDANGKHYESDCWDGAGTSIFDPVLCELAYKWFAPESGKILDPFAGGSVRGIVAEKLGYHYTGIELRPEQIAANEKQAKEINVQPKWMLGNSHELESLLPDTSYEDGFDMLFACPPYYDLELYSESNGDGSAKQTYAEFIVWYEAILQKCVARLKWNRFAVIVVGEIRDEDGWYRNFVGDTVEVMRRCKMRYYNEAILLTSIGSLPLRVNRQFGGYRKLGKTHQNVLVFYNGSNCDQIAEKFGKLL